MEPVVPGSLVPPAPFLTPEQAVKTFLLPSGFVIEPVAAEPLVDKPVTMVFDTRGRAWVCEMPEFMTDPDGSEEQKRWGRISILTDDNGDGVFDRRETFLDGIDMPRAIALVKNGVLFADQNKLYYVRCEMDKPRGAPEVIDGHYSSGGNVEHKANGLLHGRDNWIYSANSTTRYKLVDGRWISEKTPYRGQWGISQDDVGRLYYNNNSTMLQGDRLLPNLLMGNPAVKFSVGSTATLGSNRVWPARVTPGVNRAYIAKANGYEQNELDPKTHKLINTTAASGPVIYRGTNFPKEMYGWAFIGDPSVNLVKAVKIGAEDGVLSGVHPFVGREFLASTDERFRPVTLCNGPDGALYVVDMYHGIIQHKTYMTTYLRRQTLSRHLEAPARGHGRIYRIRYRAGKLSRLGSLAEADTLGLVKALGHDSGWQRETAQRLLVEQRDPAAPALLRKWFTVDRAQAQIHALWVLEGMGALSADDLGPLLKSTNPELVISAAYASLSLLDTERTRLFDAFLGMPDTALLAPYKARALASLNMPEAFAALAELLEKKIHFTRRAAMAALSKHAGAYAEAQPTKDKEFRGWLEKTMQGAKAAPEPDRYLKGGHLASFKRGQGLFLGEAACVGCHGEDGAGLPGLGPALDASDWVLGEPERLIKVLLHGLSGPITLMGQRFTPTGVMPGLGENKDMTDAHLADILTYIRSAWSNRAGAVSEGSVREVRKRTAERGHKLYTEAELQ